MAEMVFTGLTVETQSVIDSAIANACAKHPLFAENEYQVVSLAAEELGEFAQAINDKDTEKARKEALDTIAVLVRYLQYD